MNSYNYDEHANDVINYAFSEARDLGHRYIGTEHILLGLSLIKSSRVNETFLYYRITAKDIRQELIKLIGNITDSGGILDYTLRAKECLERSHEFALRSNNGEILPEHLFLSILSDKQSIGYKVLTKLSLDPIKIAQDFEADFSEGTLLIKANQTKDHEVKLMSFEENYALDDKNILSTVATDLTELVKDRPEEVTIGRGDEIDRLIQILTRKNKNNPCLVGDPGVGKTAIIKGLARKISSGDVPDALKDVKIYEINIGALISGTMYRGQFEERMNELINVLESDKKRIAFFDEIHNLVGAGATGEKSLDAFGMLKPHLTSGRIQIIGATTNEDYQKYLEHDAAINRRLLKVPVDEPSIEQTKDILMRIKQNYEDHHNVIITEKAVQSAVELSVRYIRSRKLPDKAIDIIDEACSRKRSESLKTIEIIGEIKYRLGKLREDKANLIMEMKFSEASKIQQEEKRILDQVEKNVKAKAILSSQKLVVDQDDVERVVSEWARVPINKLSTHDRERLVNIHDTLTARVFGQDEAVDTISRALKRFRVGIKEDNKSLGSFLFVGPTGVGKTELAKAIADIYFGDESNLIRIDMTEYTERHSVAKLIGAPPGYEGMKEGGLLTNAISKMPFSVVVFDEVEKGHSDVIGILLQIMDEGRLSDGRGRVFDFRNALIVMTSNLGVAEAAERQMGFIKADELVGRETKLREACEKHFRPEFINRIDEIVVFKVLDENAQKSIVDTNIKALAMRLAEKDIELEVSPDVVEHIAKVSHSAVYGARPIKRAIDKLIKDPVAELMLVEEGLDLIKVSMEAGEIKLRGESHVKR